MQHDEFTGQVQARARLASSGDAERAIRATLETLAERLDRDAADNIAAQLPPEIGRHLKTDIAFNRLSLDDFFRHVHDRERADSPGVERPDSTFHARAVIEVLLEAISAGAAEKLRQQLPPEYEPLLTSGSKGQMRTGDRGR